MDQNDYGYGYFVTYPDSKEGLVERENVEVSEDTKKVYKRFDYFVTLTHGIGITMLVLNAFYFGTSRGGFTWNGHLRIYQQGFINFHGFLMTAGFIFCQGEALIIYRVYRYEPKNVTKFLHVALHLCSLACAAVALTAIVKEKVMTTNIQMYSFHSWVGVIVISMYCIQFIVGFFNFAFPRTGYKVRSWIMPGHKWVGSLIFKLSAANVLMGHQGYACFGIDQWCNPLHNCPKNMGIVLNFSVISILFYAICVIIIITKKNWSRRITNDEKEHDE
uniref:Cytochrome b561 domain-containing protein n=1 Tax=Acrobeloides nanus TaxID=290746 RepID=A0A914CPR2_9BILA